MRTLIFLLLISAVFVMSNDVVQEEKDSYNWEAGVPHYEHVHYNHDGEIDFAPRIIGGTPAEHGDFPAQVISCCLVEHFL